MRRVASRRRGGAVPRPGVHGFDGGAGRDGDFLDAHIVAAETGVWECGTVTMSRVRRPDTIILR